MPQPTKGARLGGSPAHQRLMLANLATALFEHGRITTTEAKARRLRPLAERLITFAKRGDLAARRQVMTVVRDKDVVHTLFAEIGPRFAQRPGGYTRIVKTNPRKGDNAPMAVIELVESLTVAQEAVGGAERARGTRFQSRRARTRASGGTAAAAAPAAVEPLSGDDVVETEAIDEPTALAEAEDAAVAEDTEAEDAAVAEETEASGSDTEADDADLADATPDENGDDAAKA